MFFVVKLYMGFGGAKMKFVVCDLDGTLLLKGEKSLKKDIFLSIENLIKKDVVFACASGRTYGEMRRIFKDENIIYVPFDGAAAFFGGETLFSLPVETEFMNFFEETEDVVFHSKLISYVKSESAFFIRRLSRQYEGHVQRISKLSEIKEPVYKIGIPKNSPIKNEDFSKKLKRVYDGRDFAEFTGCGADKGKAAEILCGKFNITPDGLYVIGDNLNDIPMMRLTENSFAVYGAKYETRKAAKAEFLSAEAFLKTF